MGRPKINAEQTLARFREGTLDRIKAALAPNEKQADFIRVAVEAELERRETGKLPDDERMLSKANETTIIKTIRETVEAELERLEKGKI